MINNIFKATTTSTSYTSNDSIKNGIITAHENELALYDVIHNIEGAEDICVWHTPNNAVIASFTFHDRNVKVADELGVINVMEDGKIIAEVFRSMTSGDITILNPTGKKWISFLSKKIAKVMSIMTDQITFPAEGVKIGHDEYTVEKNKIFLNGKELMNYTMRGGLSWWTGKDKDIYFIKNNFMVK